MRRLKSSNKRGDLVCLSSTDPRLSKHVIKLVERSRSRTQLQACVIKLCERRWLVRDIRHVRLSHMWNTPCLVCKQRCYYLCPYKFHFLSANQQFLMFFVTSARFVLSAAGGTVMCKGLPCVTVDIQALEGHISNTSFVHQQRAFHCRVRDREVVF